MHTRLERPRRIAFAVLAALALCAGLFVESFAPHTDDGCIVETHCLACQLTLTTVAVSTVALPVIVRAEEVGETVWAPNETLRSEFVLANLPSRAPPLV
jgi:hypothetical protein